LAYSLNNPLSVPNPSRIEVGDVTEVRTVRHDPNTVHTLRVELEFRSAAGSDRRYGTYVVEIRNASTGKSSQLKVRSPFTAGMELQEILEVSDQTRETPSGGLALPTGLDTALAAWRSGGVSGGGGRKNNLLAELKALNVIDQSGPLVGAVP
jgi:hypothetical protein